MNTVIIINDDCRCTLLQPTRGLMVQISRLDLMVSSYLILFYIHQVNWVNYHNGMITG